MSNGSKKEEVGHGTLRFQKDQKKFMVWMKIGNAYSHKRNSLVDRVRTFGDMAAHARKKLVELIRQRGSTFTQEYRTGTWEGKVFFPNESFKKRVTRI